jgi:DNA topoisomerase-1
MAKVPTKARKKFDAIPREKAVAPLAEAPITSREEPAAKPRAKPAAKPRAKPAAKPRAKPAAKPRAKPAAGARSRSGKTGKHLVIVESPAKATTIGRYLGDDYTVRASLGHVRDLPKGKLGVDIDQDFEPSYHIMADKKKIVAELKKAAEGAEDIFLATDPDREGEAISWHLLEAAAFHNKPVRRVVFHQITPDAVREAFANDRDIDMRLVNAQQARRILDRLVGYQLSPLLWRKVQKGLSAGRVQSVALRLVVERDQAISGFVSVEYWSIAATLKPGTGTVFSASLRNLDGDKKKIELPDEATVKSIVDDLEGATYAVGTVTKQEKHSKPKAPFITSTLQQEAWRQLRFSARKTMAVAQQLYEGQDLGSSEGSIGLITYMRTDSPVVATEAIAETRQYVSRRWGAEYVPESPRRYASRSKVAQEAHEAIRPTSTDRDPESMRGHLTNDQFRLYDLVWKRMVASQMADAVLDATTVDIPVTGKSQQGYVFRATGSVVRFAGFRTLYMEAKDEEAKGPDTDSAEDEEAETDRMLPSLSQGDSLTCRALKPDQHFTQPPPRFTEASLVKVLEEHGIGRPSTYAPIVSTIVDRQYVTRERGSLSSTKLGQVVNEQLSNHFPDIMDLGFTAQLEDQLDDVANGKREWVPLLREFYGPFAKALEKATEEMPRVRVEEPTDEICELCSNPMVIKTGRFGQFLACTGFPECRNTRPLLKHTGVTCTHGGEIVERKGRGRTFFGCTRYPDCAFTANQRPEEVACPLAEQAVPIATGSQSG